MDPVVAGATGKDGDDVKAGDALGREQGGTTDATTAEINTPSTRDHETSKGPVAKSAWPACHQVSPARAKNTPATAATAAVRMPSTTA